LGHELSPEGVRPLEEKVEACKNFPKPTTEKELRRYLGMINYYRRFIPKAAQLLKPLFDSLTHTKKSSNKPVTWTESMEQAFTDSKQTLAEYTRLAFPNSNATLTLHVDASDTAMGAVLGQYTDAQRRDTEPLAFFSRKFNNAQLKYSTYDRELTAMHEAIKQFRQTIEGRELIIFTDHKPLCYAFSKKADNADS
jgi:hypothetical protein